MSTVILQTPSTVETRSIHRASMLLENIIVYRSKITELSSKLIKDQLIQGAMPAGSVAFVREALRIAGIKEPDNISYPTSALPYLHRSIKKVRAGSVLGTWFIKPVHTKIFTGFVFDSLSKPESYSPHDREQYDAFMAMPSDAMVWQSETVVWKSEWRYYVAFDCIIGHARYDDGADDDAEIPDLNIVKNCIASLDFDNTYSIDFGVLSTGETALVEVNDAWAVGLYIEAITSKNYFHFLRDRWSGLFENSRM